MKGMESTTFDPAKLAVLYYFGDLDYWKLPEIATLALIAGLDGSALRKLAAMTNDVVASDFRSSDVDAAFREMGVDAPISKNEARLALANESIKKALAGESNLFDTATHIHIHLCELGEPPPELQSIISVAQTAKSAPRPTWDLLENELRVAMYRFVERKTYARPIHQDQY